MVLLGPICIKNNNQITNTLTITQLNEHHCKQFTPAGKMLHIAITIILANVVFKLGPVQKSGKLKNVYALEYSGLFYLSAKLYNQVRLNSKSCLIN